MCGLLGPLLAAALAATVAFGGAHAPPPAKRAKAAAARRASPARSPAREAAPRKAPPAKGIAVAPRDGPPPDGPGSQECTPMPGTTNVCPCEQNGGECHCVSTCWCKGGSGGTGSTATADTDATGSTTTGSTSTTGASAGSTSGTGSTSTTGASGSTDAASDGSTSGEPGTGSTATTATTATTGTDAATGESTGDTTGESTGAVTATTGSDGDWDHTSSGIDLGGIQNGGKVSGTKVEFVATVKLAPPTSGSVYTVAVLQTVRVKIGGEADSEILFDYTPSSVTPPMSPPGDPIFSKILRFASTRFLDGATIDLNLTATYKLSDANGAHVRLFQYHAFTRHVMAYNKGLAWETKQYLYMPLDTPYRTMDPPEFPFYNYDSHDAITDPNGAVAQLGAMHHSMIPGGTVLKGDDTLLYDDGHAEVYTPNSPVPAGATLVEGILSKLGRMTTLLAYTHGNPDASFLATWGDTDTASGSTQYRALDFSLGQVTNSPGRNSEVGKAVNDNRAVPPINLAVFHACSLTSTGNRLLNALGIPATGAQDQACAGFPRVVYSKCFDLKGDHHQSEDKMLSEHAKRVYANLAKGWTIQKALDNANEQFPPAYLVGPGSDGQPDYGRMDMKARGDVKTRLISVYNSKLDPPADGPMKGQPGGYPYQWYLVNPS